MKTILPIIILVTLLRVTVHVFLVVLEHSGPHCMLGKVLPLSHAFSPALDIFSPIHRYIFFFSILGIQSALYHILRPAHVLFKSYFLLNDL